MRGDPMSPLMSPLRWTCKSTRKLAAELTRQGYRISPDTVGELLREGGFSLQGNAKILEGKQHPDRDAPFHYINPSLVERCQTHRLSSGRPAADHCRRRRIQRIPHPHLEDRAGPAGWRDRAGDHRLSLSSGDSEVEPDRAPAVLPYHHELARTASDQPRSHRPEPRSNRHLKLPLNRGHLETGT